MIIQSIINQLMIKPQEKASIKSNKPSNKLQEIELTFPNELRL